MEASKESHLQSVVAKCVHSPVLMFIQLQQARQQLDSLIASVEEIQKRIEAEAAEKRKEGRWLREFVRMTVVFAVVAIVACYLARELFIFIFPLK